MSFEKHEILELTGFLIGMPILMIVIPYFSGFLLRGFEREDYIQKVLIIGLLGVGILIGIFALRWREIHSKGKSFGMAYIHDPRKGVFYNLKGFRFMNNPLLLSLFSFVFFSVISLFAVVLRKIQFTGVPSLEQQVTKSAEILLAVEPASSSENMLQLFLISLAVSVIAYKFFKNKPYGGDAKAMYILTSAIVGGIVGWSIHMLRYGAEEYTMLFVFMFWAIGGLMTALTGSFIPFYFWHLTTNLFEKATKLYSSDSVIIFSGIMLTIIIFSWFLLYQKFKKTKQTVEETI